jgi:hypothetical protein
MPLGDVLLVESLVAIGETHSIQVESLSRRFLDTCGFLGYKQPSIIISLSMSAGKCPPESGCWAK